MKNHTTSICSGTPAEIAAFRSQMRRAIALIGGKWKLEILWLLNHRIHRFNELRRAIPGVTQHMLTAQLRELEADGLVQRTIYPEIPPRVEYEVTDEAQRMRPVFEAIFTWASESPAAKQPEHEAAPSRAPAIASEASTRVGALQASL